MTKKVLGKSILVTNGNLLLNEIIITLTVRQTSNYLQLIFKMLTFKKARQNPAHVNEVKSATTVMSNSYALKGFKMDSVSHKTVINLCRGTIKYSHAKSLNRLLTRFTSHSNFDS